MLYQDKGDFGAAASAYETAIALDAGVREDVMYPLASSYYHAGDLHAAEAAYRSVQNHSASFHFDFAICLQKLGKVLYSTSKALQ